LKSLLRFFFQEPRNIDRYQTVTWSIGTCTELVPPLFLHSTLSPRNGGFLLFPYLVFCSFTRIYCEFSRLLSGHTHILSSSLELFLGPSHARERQIKERLMLSVGWKESRGPVCVWCVCGKCVFVWMRSYVYNEQLWRRGAARGEKGDLRKLSRLHRSNGVRSGCACGRKSILFTLRPDRVNE
jgi:hypothetical protein